MKLALTALVFSISLAIPLHAAEGLVDARASARGEVQQLVERFKHAILVKDGDAMRGLFLPGGSGFSVLDRTSPDAVRVRQLDPFSYEGFAKALATNPGALEETFDNVHIETTGAVGTIWLDYRLTWDGKQSSRGVETWQIVRESDGWKISAMLRHVVFGAPASLERATGSRSCL